MKVKIKPLSKNDKKDFPQARCLLETGTHTTPIGKNEIRYSTTKLEIEWQKIIQEN